MEDIKSKCRTAAERAYCFQCGWEGTIASDCKFYETCGALKFFMREYDKNIDEATGTGAGE